MFLILFFALEDDWGTLGGEGSGRVSFYAAETLLQNDDPLAMEEYDDWS